MNAAIQQGEVLAARRFGPFSAADVLAYARASADDNPLHADATLAARAGLARPPIHGMLAMGCLESFLGGWRSGATVIKLSAKFIRPILVDEAIEVTGKVVRAAPGAPAVIRLTLKRASGDGDLVCLAEAFVAPQTSTVA